VTQAGARVIPMEVDSLRVAKITADPTPAWRDELGAVAESDPAFRATDLVAKSRAVVTRVSREVMADAVGLEQAVVTALAGAFAAEIDGVALEDSGTSPEPKGLKTQTGLTAHDATTNPLDWAILLAFQQALFAANADALGTLIVNPRDWGNLHSQTGTDGHYVAPPAPLAKVGVLNSTQIDATTTSVAYGGSSEEVLIGVRESFGVQILRERYADTGEIGLLCHARVDVGMGRAAKMGRIINLSAS